MQVRFGITDVKGPHSKAEDFGRLMATLHLWGYHSKATRDLYDIRLLNSPANSGIRIIGNRPEDEFILAQKAIALLQERDATDGVTVVSDQSKLYQRVVGHGRKIGILRSP